MPQCCFLLNGATTCVLNPTYCEAEGTGKITLYVAQRGASPPPKPVRFRRDGGLWRTWSVCNLGVGWHLGETPLSGWQHTHCLTLNRGPAGVFQESISSSRSITSPMLRPGARPLLQPASPQALASSSLFLASSSLLKDQPSQIGRQAFGYSSLPPLSAGVF